MKYKSIFKTSNQKEVVIGVFKDRNKAIKACVDYKEVGYCLDTREERIKSLEMRNFCVCGCGPDELLIEEVE